MSSSKGKSLRLSFKGESKPKKRKRVDRGGGTSSRKRTEGSDVEDVGGDEQAWVAAESATDLTGPCFLFHSSHCVAFQPTLQSVEAAAVVPLEAQAAEDHAKLLATDPTLAEQLDGAEIVTAPTTHDANVTPTSVYHVWVATKVPGSSPARYTFKSAEGKFLGADKTGSLRANMEARGPQEEWTASPSTEGKWRLRSVHNGYLGLDEVAGGKVVVRADCDAHDREAEWCVKVQWKHRHAARHAADPSGLTRTKANDPTALQLRTRDEVVARELETFKSRAGSQYLPSNYASMSKDERRALRRAEKEGRLAEEMLDRRSKLKSDKYA